MLSKEQLEFFNTVANSKLAGCFVTVDGQELRPDSVFFIKIGADFSNDYMHMMGTNGMPDGRPTIYRMNLDERLALGTDGTVVSLRGMALNRTEPYLLQLGDNGEGYVYLGSKRMARVFYQTYFGEIPDGLEVDHINRNRADNSITNMRLVSHSENCMNRQATQQHRWADDDRVMLIPYRSGDPVLTHPSKAYSIVNDCNVWKLLHGLRVTAGGWYAIMNPTADDVEAYFRIYANLNRKGLKKKCLALLNSEVA